MTGGSLRTDSDRAGEGRAAVLGAPIVHSLSPALHRAAYAALGLTGWRYEAYLVDGAALPAFFQDIESERDQWAGLSLTMPLKRAVIPLLDEISETAASVQAVNTVVFGPDGRSSGENTDIPGMTAALRERGVERVESAAVLGAGATASSALAALARMGGDSLEVAAYVRGGARATEMRQMGERLGVAVRTVPWDRADEAFAAEVVVSTTPAGATDELAAGTPRRLGTLFDVVYHPWPTRLAAAWSAYGGTVVGGLDLLVHQAALQVELMTRRSPAPLEEMRKAGEAALAAR